MDEYDHQQARYDYQRQLEDDERQRQEDREFFKRVRDAWAAWVNKGAKTWQK